jgi:hypothetical protein
MLLYGKIEEEYKKEQDSSHSFCSYNAVATFHAHLVYACLLEQK